MVTPDVYCVFRPDFFHLTDVLSLHLKVELSLVAITCGQKLNIGDISSCQLLQLDRTAGSGLRFGIGNRVH